MAPKRQSRSDRRYYMANVLELAKKGLYKDGYLSSGYVALRIECENEKGTRPLYHLGNLLLIVAFVVLCLVATWKYESEDSLLRSDKLLFLNLSLGSLVVLLYVIAGTIFGRRILKTLKNTEYVWDDRRLRVCRLAAVDLVAGIIAAASFLASNAIALDRSCGWFLGWVLTFSFIRVSFLGIILANQFLLAILAMPVTTVFSLLKFFRLDWVIDTKEVRGTVHGIDLPHWVYVLTFAGIYLPFEALTIVTAMATTGPIHGSFCTSIYDTACYPSANPDTDCHTWAFDCSLAVVTRGLSIALSIYSLVLLILYIGLVVFTMASLKVLPFELYRINHTELGFQLQTRVHTTLLYAMSIIVLWMVQGISCNSNVMVFLGYLPLELATCYLVCTTLVLRMPICLSEEDVDALQWNQTVVWDEERIAAQEQARPLATRNSVFCFEMALKAFYFSYLVYDIEEDANSPFDIDMAMSLYDLSEYKLLWQRSLDAKCLCAWSVERRIIVVSFRGSASKKNFITDAKVWRMSHPPQRGRYLTGTMPLIHTGFNQFWYESGLREDLMALLKEIIIDSADSGEAWDLYCFGHSLGGAAAKLAAVDIASQLPAHADKKVCIWTMTFGCPYVGNHAFAKEYRENVPNSWDIFHPNDAVSTSGKFFYLYERESQVCLVSKFGDLIINPSHLEKSTLHRFHTKSVSEHLLSTYSRSFLSIIQKNAEIEAVRDLVSKPELGPMISLLKKEFLAHSKDHGTVSE
mmetsp:Transcript_2846/g.5761  ORF Transcript_2846/g.5761 Transcript_2846/m.5761 type:complete len:747 (-) Transcript_2846:3665-5905(-)